MESKKQHSQQERDRRLSLKKNHFLGPEKKGTLESCVRGLRGELGAMQGVAGSSPRTDHKDDCSKWVRQAS